MVQKFLATMILLTYTASAFAWGWDKVEGLGKANVPGVLDLTTDWLKDKDDKFDVSLKLTNLSKETILLFIGDMSCVRGTETNGTINNHSDRRTIDLRSNESRSVILTCQLKTKNKGNFSLDMKVFSNPSGDSNTPGKVLAEKVEWKQGAHEGKIIK